MRRGLINGAVALLGVIIVTDGDTVKMDGVRYRLLGFDTPETFHARCSKERALGKLATERLRQLLAESEARLVPNGKGCKWGRQCASLYLDGRDAAEIMIGEGLAVPYRNGPRKDWCG